MQSIKNILDSFEPISLEQMDSVQLMNRTDTKFVFELELLGKVLNEIREHYFVLDINKQRAQADWYFVPSVTQIETQENYAESYYANNNENHLNASSTEAEAITDFPSLAPPYPIIDPPVHTENTISEAVFFGVYPIPFSDDITIKIY